MTTNPLFDDACDLDAATRAAKRARHDLTQAESARDRFDLLCRRGHLAAADSVLSLVRGSYDDAVAAAQRRYQDAVSAMTAARAAVRAAAATHRRRARLRSIDGGRRDKVAT